MVMWVTARHVPLPKDTIGPMTTSIRMLAMLIGLSGAAPASAGPFSATRDVIAIMAGDLYVGEAEGHLDGSGTLLIHSQRNPTLTCRGQFTSNDKTSGVGQLECSDGATATFKFQRLSILGGHGTGDYSRGSMSFAYGLTHEEASSFLKLPAGKRLSHNGTTLAMVDQ
jgi:hypothetical protein